MILFQGAKDPSKPGFWDRFGKKPPQGQQPFPAITPQSYLPGTPAAAGYNPYPGNVPPGGPSPFPNIGGPPPYPMPPQPPNYGHQQGMQPPYPPSPMPPYMPYPNMNPMQMRQRRRPSPYPGGYPMDYYKRRPRPRRRRHCSSPAIYVVRSDSCSSISTCSTISYCSDHRYRSCSRPRKCPPTQPAQPQIIVVPINCQQSTPTSQNQSSILRTVQQQQDNTHLSPNIINLGPTPLILQGNKSAVQPVIAKSNTLSFAPSQLQSISIQPLSCVRSQHAFVNSANNNGSTIRRTLQRTRTIMNLNQKKKVLLKKRYSIRTTKQKYYTT